MRRPRPAFTLVELIIAIIIAAVLATLVVPTAARATKRARQTRIVADLHAVQRASDTYRHVVGAFPVEDGAVTDPVAAFIASGRVPGIVTDGSATVTVEPDGSNLWVAIEMEHLLERKGSPGYWLDSVPRSSYWGAGSQPNPARDRGAVAYVIHAQSGAVGCVPVESDRSASVDRTADSFLIEDVVTQSGTWTAQAIFYPRASTGASPAPGP